MQLRALAGTLTITRVDVSWWQVRATIEEADHVLGSDSGDVIVARLRQALEPQPGAQGPTISYQGVPVAWVLSLFEEHCSIYVGTVEGARVFFFQDAQGRLLGGLRITAEDEVEWRRILEAEL